ncbi:hypothetical protein [Flagellimonas crocea]|uniref:hypothetical protein n=1 Tax=Flagellimonas crocea TaxID=3067311 RepID=UPI00296FADF8|nr:hypothetical protein [Muricauda sp. DH64]
MNLKTIVGYLFLAVPLTGIAQSDGIPLRILAGNEAVSMPFNNVWSAPSHLTGQLGSEFGYRSTDKHYLYQTINIGFVDHKNLFRGGYLNTELGYDYKLFFGLNLKALLGIGYLHTFSTEEEYVFDDGEYRNNKDKGNSRVMPSFSLGVGYRLHQKSTRSAELMLLYRSWLEFPYSPGFISVMSHTDLSLGIKFYIF